MPYVSFVLASVRRLSCSTRCGTLAFRQASCARDATPPDRDTISSHMDLTLPLDYAAIERILPHRFPFLLVDRIIEFEVDKRIVGIKNVSLNDPYLSHATGGGAPALPPTILTEAIAQVGAILILAKPENRQRLPLFAGIKRVRYRRAVHPGDVVVFEAVVVRLHRRMGVLKGFARVDNKIVVEGTMTFALASAGATRSIR
jgi:3-hydroxyacyl-[acyl-carrier-protein] dehydratase